MSKINILKLNKDGTIGLGRLLIGTNTNKDEVEYYKIEKEGKTLIITLYDKDKTQIKIKNKEEN